MTTKTYWAISINGMRCGIMTGSTRLNAAKLAASTWLSPSWDTVTPSEIGTGIFDVAYDHNGQRMTRVVVTRPRNQEQARDQFNQQGAQ